MVFYTIIRWLAYRGKLDWLPDRMYLKVLYYATMHKKLELTSPQTFNEKLQWLKLYDHNPEYTKMVDKYEAKKYAADRLGKQHIIPTLGVYDRFEDIDFDALPDRFVLKCTHDSGGLVIVKDKHTFDRAAAKVKIKRSLNSNYYYTGREWPYKNVKPRIIAEQYMEDFDGSGDLTDYKIHCYSGEPKAIQVISNRYGPGEMRNDYFDLNWVNYGLQRGHYTNSNMEVKKPAQMNEILALSRILSANIPFLRVDFYVINNKVYFGEMTFFPASGFRKFTPEFFDAMFGEWITLPEKTR